MNPSLSSGGSLDADALGPRRSFGAALLLVVIVAALLRIPALAWGLPDRHHSWPYLSDEAHLVRVFENMRPSQGDWNPRFFIFPSLMVYVGGAALRASAILGAVTLVSDRAFYEAHPEELAKIYLVLRLVALTASLVGIIGIAHLGRMLHGAGSGILAASLLAFSTGHTAISSVATPHVLANLLSIVTVASAWKLSGDPRTWSYVRTGVCLGLAVGTLYDSALMFLPLLAAHLMVRPRRFSPCREDGRLAAAVLAAAVVFLMTTPYLFAGEDVGRSFAHIRAHVGSQVPSLFRFAGYLAYAVSSPVAFLAAAAVIAAILRRKRSDLLLLAWILPYSLVILRSGPAFMRREIAIIPPLLLLVAQMLLSLPRRIRIAVAALAVVSAAIPTLAYLDAYRLPDVRSEAQAWVETNVPPGESIAVWDWHLGPHLDVDRNPVSLLTRREGDTAAWIVATNRELPLEEAVRRWPDARLVKRFRREPRLGPFRYSLDGAPEDWLYPIPDIYILDRAQAADPVDSGPASR